MIYTVKKSPHKPFALGFKKYNQWFGIKLPLKYYIFLGMDGHPFVLKKGYPHTEY